MVKQLLTKRQKEYESAQQRFKTAVREYDRALDQGHRQMDASKVIICLKDLI